MMISPPLAHRRRWTTKEPKSLGAGSLELVDEPGAVAREQNRVGVERKDVVGVRDGLAARAVGPDTVAACRRDEVLLAAVPRHCENALGATPVWQ